MKIPALLQSSVDPNKISLTVKAIASGIIPFVTVISAVFGVDISVPVLQELSDNIERIVVSVWAAGSALAFLWGLLRKLITRRQ